MHLNCFVTQIDLALADKMKEDLISQGFTLSQPPYTLFSAQKPGLQCTLYTSGKLTVQGKNKSDFITFYLEPEILKALPFSNPQIAKHPHIGIDEAGKGDFFGPLCIAGVQANGEQIEKLHEMGVRDSKTLSDKTISSLSQKIKAMVPHSIVRISPIKYNELYYKFRNLNHLLAWGHATAIGELVEKTGCTDVIIDQFADESVVIHALKKKDLKVHLTQRHGAEEDLVVAAASILARATFVHELEKLGESVGQALPKGASNHVIEAGKKLIARHGDPILGSVAKLHFKTKDQILNHGFSHE